MNSQALLSRKNLLYSIPDAFCCVENMVLEATNLGIASRIIAREEETFDNEQKKWIDIIFEEQPYLSNVYPNNN